MVTVCWHDRPRWDCGHDFGDLVFIRWGRCRAGRRWFWTAAEATGQRETPERHGTEDTEAAALAAARAAVEDLAAGRPALAEMRHGDASRALRELNAARRASRAPSGETGAGTVGYLYGARHWVSDDATVPDTREVVPFRIVKATARRVYYLRRDRPGDAATGYVDRAALERDGHADNRGCHWSDADSTLYATREAAEDAVGLGRAAPADAPDLARLKREMADAHPDRGGTAAEFTAARERYKRALQEAS